MNFVVLVLGDAYDRWNMLRIHRRSLRDGTDPFQIPEARFMELFRFSGDAARELLEEISPFMKNGIRNTYIPKSIRLLYALHFYATGSYLTDIGQDFMCAMSKSMTSLIVKEVSTKIEAHLCPKYVYFPCTLVDQEKIMRRFYDVTGFPGVIGAIDCTHIKIKKPSMDVEYCYKNRKGYFSKNVQLICDYDLQILAAYARYGGATHDACIWDNSGIKNILEIQCNEAGTTHWLIGDSGYPLQPWLMTPFRSPENRNQENYNFHHIRARNCVERLNGVLKKVFGCLSGDRGLLASPSVSGTIINVCCTLHNIRLKKNQPMPDVHEDLFESENVFQQTVSNESVLNQARRVRENIVRNHF